MNVKALVHGSFGFVLQEAHADEPALFDSLVKAAVAHIHIAKYYGVTRMPFMVRRADLSSVKAIIQSAAELNLSR